MPNYDVVFIHPPAIYDFRKKVLFPGVMASSVEQAQLNKVPIGMLSLAEYLDRHGYKVVVDNLCDRMVNAADFDAEKHVTGLSATIFAVGLHFQQHAQGALEIARMCKEKHPGSMVVLGGLMATRFHEEIIRKYPFVDFVIRAEAEKPFLQLLRVLESNKNPAKVRNLTWRKENGEVMASPLAPASTGLDEFEYTRFDLLEPQTSVFPPDSVPRWSLEVCRGCIYNCAICGGSAYTYRTYLGMAKPAFRSPYKIVQDIKELARKGVASVGLYQDPRMGGEKYWRELLTCLQKEKPGIERLSLDLLAPADEVFIREIAAISVPVTLHICPDSGCDAVRKRLGRPYSSEQLLNTVRLCHKYLIPVTSFFSVGLAGESVDSVQETFELWEKLISLEQILLTRQRSLGTGSELPLGGPIMGPIVLDPGSLAFDYPEKYGYKLLYKNLEQYVDALSLPSWHQWMNYETELLNKSEITELNFHAVAFTIAEREAYGLYSAAAAQAERLKLKSDIISFAEVNRILKLPEREQEEQLKALKNRLDNPG